VTLTAVVLAAGVTIGSVVSAVTKALKASGKAMSASLKEVGGEAWLSAARTDWPGRALPFQHRCQGRRLSRRTHLATHFGGCCVCGRKIPPNEKVAHRQDIKSKRLMLPFQQSRPFYLFHVAVLFPVGLQPAASFFTARVDSFFSARLGGPGLKGGCLGS